MSLLWLLIRLVLLSRRSIAALLAYAVVLGVFYAAPGPLAEAYVPTAAALVLITAWLVVAGVAGLTESRSTAGLLCAAARGPLRLHLMITAAGVVTAVPLIMVSLVVARFLAEPPSGLPVVIAGLAAHVVATLIGAGLGAVAARPVVGESALAPAVVISGFVLVVVVSASSPLGPVLRLLGDTGSEPFPALVEVAAAAALWCGLALVWAVVLTMVGGSIAAHRRTYGTNAAA